MDPNACLERLMNAIVADDLDEARAALADYRAWRAGGGFEPVGGDARAASSAKLLNHLIGLKRRAAMWTTAPTTSLMTAYDVELAYGALLLAAEKMPDTERRIAAIRLGHDAEEHGEGTPAGKLAVAISDLLDPVDEEV